MDHLNELATILCEHILVIPVELIYTRIVLREFGVFFFHFLSETVLFLVHTYICTEEKISLPRRHKESMLYIMYVYVCVCIIQNFVNFSKRRELVISHDSFGLFAMIRYYIRRE